MRSSRSRLVVVPCLGVMACASLAFPAMAQAVQLPPGLIRALEADRRQAGKTLATARARLGDAATRQRAAAAGLGRASATTEVVRGVARVAGLGLPPATASQLEQLRDRHEREVERAGARLESMTEAAARAQAVALDADRRIRALQRASRTEDERDTTLGSWRFGSGGPAVSAASIDDYLAAKGSPMAGQGAAFLESGVQHEVDPRLVVAIAGAESYFGITTCAPFNGWGWGCPNGPFRFEDWAHGIETVTTGLREGYLDDGLESVGEIHLRYAPPDAANDPTDLNYGWADNVARFLVEQGGDPQDISGVVGPSR